MWNDVFSAPRMGWIRFFEWLGVGKMHPIETIIIEKPQLGGENIWGLLVEFLFFLPFAVQGVTQL